MPPQSDFRYARIVLPPCMTETDRDCIVSLEMKSRSGEWLKGSFSAPIPLTDLKWLDEDFRRNYLDVDNPRFLRAIPDLAIPAGGRTGIWTLPSGRHQGGTEYALSVTIDGEATNVNATLEKSNPIKWTRGFEVKLGTFDSKNLGGGCSGAFIKATYTCHPINIFPFPKSSIFRVTVNLKETLDAINLSKWLLAQVSNSGLKEEILSDKSRLLMFEGSPLLTGAAKGTLAKTPKNYELLKSAQMQQNKRYLESLVSWGRFTQEQVDQWLAEDTNYTYEAFLQQSNAQFDLRTPGTLEAWQTLEEASNPEYMSVDPSWRFEALRLSNSDRALMISCGYGELAPGLVATNAVAMSLEPPTWDSKTKELTYQVAAPHLRNMGKNLGLYELSIDKKLATCLWGKDSLQARAAISVESTSGEKKLSTVQMALQDDSVKFRAAGFTYSSSFIRVSLGSSSAKTLATSNLDEYFMPLDGETSVTSETKVAQSQESLSAKTSRRKVQESKVLNCRKGKVTITVSGPKVKCPKGYSVIKK